MSSEIELKLGIPTGDAQEVARLPWLRQLSGGRIERRKLRSVYFDTRRLKLHEHGVVLRVRHADRGRVQTIKADRASRPFARKEWEHDISGDRPDLKFAQGTPLSPLAKKKLRRKLRPVFETVVERVSFPIRADGAELELAIDRGHIRAQGVRERDAISEIEIELKDGDPAGLSKLARRLARSAAVAYMPRSKAERGYALKCRKRVAPVRAIPRPSIRCVSACPGILCRHLCRRQA